ncbi:MAG TPA: protease pro-enzyme activation domain-containing protein, partial [Acidimicrobiales bacterium]
MQAHAIRRVAVVAVATIALLGANAVSSRAAATSTAGGPSRTPVPGSAPRWAKPNRDVGDVAGNRQVTVSVYLALRDPAGAEALVQQVSDPTSSTYGAYISPDQFASQYEASAADVSAVEHFLTNSGLTIDSADSSSVVASGALSSAEAAFGATVHRYAYRGRVLDAPTATLSVPSSLAGKVSAVTGLDQSGTLTRPQHDVPGTTASGAASAPTAGHAGTTAPPPAAFVNAPPCSTYFGQKVATQYPAVNGQHVPFAPCGYTPAQYQGAYGTSGLVSHGLDGRGVTVAITDAYAAPTILQDANQYARRHGQPTMSSHQFSQIVPNKFRYGYDDTTNGDLCGEQGWYGEETLDVEAVHAMAPGAKILYVAGKSCDDPDLLGALDKIVSKHRADIITNSWGDIGEDVDADTLQAYHSLFLKAAAEGIGVFYSS